MTFLPRALEAPSDLQVRMEAEGLPADYDEKTRRLLLLEQMELLRRASRFLPQAVPGPQLPSNLSQAPGSIGNAGTFPVGDFLAPLLGALLQPAMDPSLMGTTGAIAGASDGGQAGFGSKTSFAGGAPGFG